MTPNPEDVCKHCGCAYEWHRYIDNRCPVRSGICANYRFRDTTFQPAIEGVIPTSDPEGAEMPQPTPTQRVEAESYWAVPMPSFRGVREELNSQTLVVTKDVALSLARELETALRDREAARRLYGIEAAEHDATIVRMNKMRAELAVLTSLKKGKLGLAH